MLTCSWGLYHCRGCLRPESAGTAEQSDLAAVCWDPCDLLAWSPVTVVTDTAHQPTAAGTPPLHLNEPPCTARPLWREPRDETEQKKQTDYKKYIWDGNEKNYKPTNLRPRPHLQRHSTAPWSHLKYNQRIDLSQGIYLPLLEISKQYCCCLGKDY